MSQNSDRVELRILRALRRIIRATDIHSRKLAGQHKITTPQLITLMCIVEEGSIASSEIARRVHLGNSTLVGILDRLESKGLVRRERSTKDRRVVHVVATDKGVKVSQTAPSPLQDELVHRIGELSPDERTRIAESLERIVSLMQAQDIDAAPLLDVGKVDRTEDPTS